MLDQEPTTPDSGGPKENEELSAAELEVMKSYLSKHPEENLRRSCVLTPAEHSLLGSTWPGKVFHPNLPIAALATGVSLEEVNRAREKQNGSKLFIRYMDRDTPDGDLYEVYFDLLPLSEDQLGKAEPEQTYTLVSATKEGLGKKPDQPVEIDDKVISRVKALISENPAAKKEYFIKHYLKGKEI
jgi:hypothetical protein